MKLYANSLKVVRKRSSKDLQDCNLIIHSYRCVINGCQSLTCDLHMKDGVDFTFYGLEMATVPIPLVTEFIV